MRFRGDVGQRRARDKHGDGGRGNAAHFHIPQGRHAGGFAEPNGDRQERKIFLRQSNIKDGNLNGSLALEDGLSGASAGGDASQAGAVYFTSAEIAGGGLAYENFANHNAFKTGATDRIEISGALSKTGGGKILVDFSDRGGGALDLSGYELADSVGAIENWAEILSAGKLPGFDLESKIGENAYDANGDFYAAGVENGVAVFRWAESIGDGRCKPGLRRCPKRPRPLPYSPLPLRPRAGTEGREGRGFAGGFRLRG